MPTKTKTAKAKPIKGKVHGKKEPIGKVLNISYHVKDSDSVPAILTKGEYVLSKKMVKTTKRAYQKANMKPPKGL